MKTLKWRGMLLAALSLGVSTAWAGETISKNDWVGHMKQSLPAYVCKDGSYFRSCFSVDAKGCNAAIAEAVDGCVSQMGSKIPAQLNQPEDGKKWGEQLGSCAGTAYEKKLSGKKISNDKCNNPDNWK